MSRKDYLAVAAEVVQATEMIKADAKAGYITPETAQAKISTLHTFIVDCMVPMFRRDNSLFDRSKFLLACGINR